MLASLTLTNLSIYFLLGAAAGMTAGLMGLGGGIVIVPGLLYLFLQLGFTTEHLMHVAVATSLATIVFTSVVSAWSHHRNSAVLWPQVFQLLPGILIGAVIGAVIADQLAGDYLRRAFGLFEMLVALQIGLQLQPDGGRELPQKSGMLFAGTGIGGFSTILGIGGGTLTVPFLHWCNVDMRKAVGTSSACGFPIALAGAISMMIVGSAQTNLPENTIGYVYWPAAVLIVLSSTLFAPLGAKIAHTISVSLLKKLFAVVLFFIGLRMVL